MKALLVTLGMLGLLYLSSQFLRHLYVKWIAPTASVLDKYEDQTDKGIAASESLESLLQQYDEAYRKVKEWEKDKTEEERVKASSWEEPHKSADKLKQAIKTWEGRTQEIAELHFFWWCGLVCIALGLGCFVWGNQWLGVAAMAVGFAEMIYWTSPPFLGRGGEFQRLLFWKLIYTTVSLVLFLGLWGYFVRTRRYT